MMKHTITLEESERQAVILALAELSIARPGYAAYLNDIALKMDNPDPVNPEQAQMFEQFRQNHTAALRAKLTGEIDTTLNSAQPEGWPS